MLAAKSVAPSPLMVSVSLPARLIAEMSALSVKVVPSPPSACDARSIAATSALNSAELACARNVRIVRRCRHGTLLPVPPPPWASGRCALTSRVIHLSVVATCELFTATSPVGPRS